MSEIYIETRLHPEGLEISTFRNDGEGQYRIHTLTGPRYRLEPMRNDFCEAWSDADGITAVVANAVPDGRL